MVIKFGVNSEKKKYMLSIMVCFFNNPNSPSLTLEIYHKMIEKLAFFKRNTFCKKAFSQPAILMYLIPFKISVATAILSSFFSIIFPLNLENNS